MALWKQILLLVFCVCFTNIHSYEIVPVYMWEMSKLYSPLPALNRINPDFLADVIGDKFTKDKVIVVFQEENLSAEDFNTYDSTGNSVFSNLSQMKSIAQINYYPFVESPLNALISLAAVKVKTISVNDLPSNIDVNPGQLLIIDLNDAKENEDRYELLSRHDAVIASIYKKLSQKHKNLIAVYTSKSSSWEVPSQLSSRKTRSLLEANEMADNQNNSNPFLIKTNDALIYIQEEITVIDFKENSTVNFYNMTGFDTHSSTKANNSLNVTASGSSGVLIFAFEEVTGYWYLTNIKLNLKDNKEVDIDINGIYAPNSYSYHCNNTEFSSNETAIKLPGFQVQAFINGTDRFNDAYDCIGFSTAPIWSGLFVTFILALIMTFGLCMIMDIKTMDRFDDPKGKTISINVVE